MTTVEPNAAPARIALLPDRGVVSVIGPDARSFLDNLITNDMDRLQAPGDAIHAALLSPQGKILFDFFVVQTPAGFLLETGLDHTAALARRLALYKLRAKVEIKDAAGEVVVVVSQGAIRARPQGEHFPPDLGQVEARPIRQLEHFHSPTGIQVVENALAIAFVDPRSEQLGDRVLLPATAVGELIDRMGAHRMLPETYAAHRVAAVVPEAGRDYVLGDTFPHEANFDRLRGVSFTKGCFIGQEVVARMQNKTVVRKRVVRVTAPGPIGGGADIRLGEGTVGRIGTVAACAGGTAALAMLRLDRAVEAADKGQPLTVDGVTITVAPEALDAYRKSVAERPVVDL